MVVISKVIISFGLQNKFSFDTEGMRRVGMPYHMNVLLMCM